MDYEMEYIVYGEWDDIYLVVEFSYNGDEFSIESVSVRETGAEYEDYDEEDVMEKMVEHAEKCASEWAEEQAISRWESKQESQYL